MKRPLLSVCICLFVLIALIQQLVNPPPFQADNTGWEGKNVALTGQVYQKEFRVSFGEEKLIIYLKSNELSKRNPIENIICEINVSELPKGSFVPELGSIVLVQGIWKGFEHATNPGEFDAANYYAIEGVCARIQNAKLLAAGTDHWRIREALYQCRRRLLQNLYQAYPQKEASILAKMLLGDGSGLDKDIKNLYQSNGIVHILSISGLHITMLGMGLYKLLRRLWLPIIPAAVCGGIGILLYGCMTGFGVSACRAIGMYLIHMLGEIWGKTYDMLTAMGVLGLVMLLENPMLAYHSGFLLSFTSVCGVGILMPYLQLPANCLRKTVGDCRYKVFSKKLIRSLCDSLSVSLAVTIFTLPIQLFFFYKIPVYSVFLNLLIIPFMSALMVSGIVVMIIPVFSLLCYVGISILEWFEWLCMIFEKLPFHTLVVGEPSIWKILLYYMVLAGILLAGKRVKKYGVWISMILLVVFIVLPEKQCLEITILDVGQGDCICVQTANGGCYLFDGGSSSRQNIGEKVILPFLLHQGIDKVDAVFLSHADTDHTNGIQQLVEEALIPIEKLYLPDIATKEDFEALIALFGENRIQYIQKGDSWQSGECSWTCLHPYKDFQGESNSYSACFLLKQGDFRMLLAGDIEGDGEVLLQQELIRRGIGQVTVLKVAHHGSKYSTTEEFLQIAKPQISIISCGKKNSYGHPHRELLERLEKVEASVWRTPQAGAIHIYETSKGMQMSAYNIDFEG